MNELPHELLSLLEAMHARLAERMSKWVKELEGSYISRDALRRYDPANARHLHIDRGGSVGVEQHDIDWVIQRHVLREHGVVLTGPALPSLIDPVAPAELRQAVLGTLHGWWRPMIHSEDPMQLRHTGYQAYAVLTMCRILYSLEHLTIVSKLVAARWAQQRLGEPWAALIGQAIAWRDGAPFDNSAQTRDFIRFTIEQSQQFQTPAESTA